MVTYRPRAVPLVLSVIAIGSIWCCVAGGLSDRKPADPVIKREGSKNEPLRITGGPGTTMPTPGSITLLTGTYIGAWTAPVYTCGLCGKSSGQGRTVVMSGWLTGQRVAFRGCCDCLIQSLDDYARITSKNLVEREQ